MATSNEFNFKVAPDTFALGHFLAEYRKKEEFIDVKLQIKEKLFPAHRNILSVHSPVLKAMISDQWSTTKICQLSNEFVDEEIMEDLLNFLYTGEIKLTPDNVHPVCVAAHFLQISILLEPAAKYLCKQIVAENVLPLYLFSKSRDIDSLTTCCLRFLSSELGKVFQDLLILDFSFQDLKDLIVGLKVFYCDSKICEKIFDCVVRWAEKDLSKRFAKLPILLENIPLEELSVEFFTQTMSSHPLVKEPLFYTLSEFRAKASNVLSETKQKLIVFGGQTAWRYIVKSSVLCFDPDTRVWNALPNMLQARTSFGAVVKERNIVVCGGYISGGESISSVEMFEWSSQTWTELPSLPLRLQSTSMAIHNGQLYVAGGRIGDEDQLSTVLCYSFETSEWRYVKSMNVARMDGHLIAYKNYLYAIGGWTDSVERYDPIQDKWTKMANMKNAYEYHGATLHQDQIYVCGKSDVQAYDIKENVWNSLPAPLFKPGSKLVSLNGKLLAIGKLQKHSDMSECHSIQKFNFSNQLWEEFGELPSALVLHCSLSGPFY